MAKKIIPPTLPTLAHCPFCGSGGVAPFEDSGPRRVGVWPRSGAGAHTFSFSVCCDGCGAEGPSGATELEAAEKWNAHGSSHAADTLPANPLIQGCASDTLAHVAAFMTWMQWHPLATDSIPAAHVKEELDLADYQLRTMLRDAIRHEAERAGGAA